MTPDDLAPRVSVVIPTRDYGRFLAAAIDGALAQDLPELEVLIVDDGSTDDTPRIVAPYLADPRVRYLAQPPGGVSAARNRGVREARGRYVALLDADDRWPCADKLSSQAAFLDAHPEVGWIFGDARMTGRGEGDRLFLRGIGYYAEESPLPRVVPLTVRELCTDPFGIPTSSVLVRRRCLEEAGGFDEELGMYEDLDLWIRLLRRYPVAFVPRALVTRHFHGGNLGAQRTRHLEALRKVVERHGLEAEGVDFRRDARESALRWARARWQERRYGAAREMAALSLRHGWTAAGLCYYLLAGIAGGRRPVDFHAAGRRLYGSPDVVAFYGRKEKLWPDERFLLDSLGGEMRGRALLDLGVGAGRTIPFLAPLAGTYTGIDYSPGMIELARSRHPDVDLRCGDATRLEPFADGSFDVVFFSFNGIDHVDDDGRRRILAEVHRVLRAPGLFVFSSHNLEARRRSPFRWRGRPAGIVNYLRNRRHQRRGEGYAIVVDEAHEYRSLIYYTTARRQLAQLEAAGFAGIEVVADGAPADPAAPRPEPWLYYVARKS